MADPPSSGAPEGAFDIVKTYHDLLSNDPELTMPVAAIEALVALLAATPNLTTISETLALLDRASARLQAAVANPISLSAGTDLFTRYIVTSLRPAGGGGSSSSNGVHAAVPAGGDFAAVRAHLLANGRLFAARAKDARRTIAGLAARLVPPGATVLTNGGSRVVGAVLAAAATAQAAAGGAPRFRVVWATGPAGVGRSTQTDAWARTAAEGAATIAALRRLQVPVAEIGEAAVAYAMGEVTMALVGAEGVVETGGVISRLGTYQLALLARAANRPVYVAAERHKFVRRFPLGQYDLGLEQRVLDFRTAPAEAGDSTPTDAAPAALAAPASPAAPMAPAGSPQQDPPAVPLAAVDYTPPELVTALVTEAGVLTPSAVSEELIKIWY